MSSNGAGGARRPRRPGLQTYTQAAVQAGYQSGDRVSLLVERFTQRGLASLPSASGRGRQAPYRAAQRERILQELQRVPDRQADGTATWSLKTLERALRCEARARSAAPPRLGRFGRRDPGWLFDSRVTH